jgi:hypothetical protein
LTTVEFSNIEQEELIVLNGYIQTVLIPAMQQDAATTTYVYNSSGEEDENNSSNKALPMAPSDAFGNEDVAMNDSNKNKDKAETDKDESDEEDENFEMDDDKDDNRVGWDDNSAQDDCNDDHDNNKDNIFEVVPDDFAQELAKKRRKIVEMRWPLRLKATRMNHWQRRNNVVGRNRLPFLF